MFKKAGKVIFAESCQTGNLLQSKVFRKVVADIVGVQDGKGEKRGREPPRL